VDRVALQLNGYSVGWQKFGQPCAEVDADCHQVEIPSNERNAKSPESRLTELVARIIWCKLL
jgi:hypothetical protein